MTNMPCSKIDPASFNVAPNQVAFILFTVSQKYMKRKREGKTDQAGVRLSFG
jgi:hypothetical protein